ncbi:MAG TPA: hypothetical protein DCR97_07880 [Deltaproteobacteria bacterium]|nr:hypothetical protein [Deltaproteobacteria bacterium]
MESAVSIAYVLVYRSWDRSASVLVITGIFVSAVLQACVSIVMYVADPYNQLASIVVWIMGSFHVASWAKVGTTLPIVVMGSVLITIFGWRLNIMTQNPRYSTTRPATNTLMKLPERRNSPSRDTSLRNPGTPSVVILRAEA